jgi:phosphoglycerol transferase MdoB-like AlkP superfamily enzyme
MVNSTAVAMGGVYVAWMLYLMRVGISVMFHYGLTARNFLITSVLFGGTFACVWFNHFIWGGILELLAVLMALITASIEFEE